MRALFVLPVAFLGACSAEPQRQRPAQPVVVAATPAAPPQAPALQPCPKAMVEIAGGSLLMGRDDGDDDEKPAHKVEVGTFCMDVTEVSVAAFRRCVDAGACNPPLSSTIESESAQCIFGKPGRDHDALNCASWHEAEAYCRWAGKRLPSEEEWELAARGPKASRYPWGDAEPVSQACWKRERNQGPCPVGSFPSGASPSGALDLAGNVREWTSSMFCPYASAASCAPWNGVTVRGASWRATSASELRSTARTGLHKEERMASTGLRCAKGPARPPRALAPEVAKVCECYKKAYNQATCEGEAASSAIGGVNADCMRTYEKDCGMMIACSRGEPGARPTCLPGYKNWGAFGGCGKACKKDADCAAGEECRSDFGVCLPKDPP